MIQFLNLNELIGCFHKQKNPISPLKRALHQKFFLGVIPAKAGIHGPRVPLENVLKQELYSIRVSPWMPGFGGLSGKRRLLVQSC
jgi:hypothetical protein